MSGAAQHPLADDCAAEVQERLAQLGRSLVAGAPLAPRECALHDPALADQSQAVLDVAPCYDRLDAPYSQLSTVLVAITVAVGEQPIGALARPPRLPLIYSIPSINASNWVTSWRLAPISEIASGTQLASVTR